MSEFIGVKWCVLKRDPRLMRKILSLSEEHGVLVKVDNGGENGMRWFPEQDLLAVPSFCKGDFVVYPNSERDEEGYYQTLIVLGGNHKSTKVLMPSSGQTMSMRTYMLVKIADASFLPRCCMAIEDPLSVPDLNLEQARQYILGE